MVEKFKDILDNLIPYIGEKRLLIAISGGVDSVVLAHLCKASGLHFALCHVNYHLRGLESDGDADFVADLANQLGVPLFLLENDLSKFDRNIQLEARESRYEWFADLLVRKEYNYVLTAHHLNDSAESLLFNVGRGTGLSGLLGVPAQNEKIIRPLLNFSKAQILKFANDKDIAHREDASNTTDKYARNFLRHHVIPKLEEQNPHFLLGVQKTLTHLQGSAYFANKAMDDILQEALVQDEHRFILKLDKLAEHQYLSHILFYWLAPYGFSGKQVQDFSSTKEWKNGANLMSRSHRLLYDRGHFVLTEIKDNHTSRISFNPAVISSVVFGEYRFHFSLEDTSTFSQPTHNNEAYFDADKIEMVSIRYWENGDVFQPFGMDGKSKTVKKLFVDGKYDLDQKANTPILLHKMKTESEIMWVCALRTDHRYRVQNGTGKVLKVVMDKVEN